MYVRFASCTWVRFVGPLYNSMLNLRQVSVLRLTVAAKRLLTDGKRSHLEQNGVQINRIVFCPGYVV